MRWGFKTEARKLALEVRAELGLDAYVQFDPYFLAEEYGIPVYQLSDLGQQNGAGDAARYFMSGRTHAFSAALVPIGCGMFILDNDDHLLVRRRNSISHEMSHVMLEHAFGKVILTSDGCRCFDKDKEEEATWLAGELLIPYAAAERAARSNLTDEQVAAQFDVSPQLAGMRMNFSGARKVVARKRAYSRGHRLALCKIAYKRSMSCGNGVTVNISPRFATENTRPSQSRMTGPSVSFALVQPKPPSTATSGTPPRRSDSARSRSNRSALSRAVPPSFAPLHSNMARSVCGGL